MFVALTGNGWPAQVKRSHKLHEEFAKKTLYAYMPCKDLAGTEYIDAVVQQSYGGRYSELLLDFVNDRHNKWCPTWIRRNYEIQNKDREDVITAPASIALINAKGDTARTSSSDAAGALSDGAFPHSEKFTSKFVFDPAGEPSIENDTERPEEYTSDHHWDK